MAAYFSRELECTVCLSVFTDPLSLPCDHTFCRVCIESHIITGGTQCPNCRAPFAGSDLKPNRILNNLAIEAVKEKAIIRRRRPRHKFSGLLCPDHNENLKLLCRTDQQLVCLICRDGKKHRGHEFEPAQEAARPRRDNLKGALEFLSMDNSAMDNLIKQQESEIQKTKEKSNRLMTEFGAQFGKMHEFLRKREAEVARELLNEEGKCLESMNKNLVVITDRLMRFRETEAILQSALDIAEPDYYLQWWLEKGEAFVEGLKESDDVKKTTERTPYQSRVNDLQVIPDSLSLDPYETHLQFFMWKEMLQVIRSVPEPLIMKNDREGNLKVSAEGFSIWPVDKETGFKLWSNKGCKATMYSSEWVHYGQHYWEVHVGGKLDWTLGVKSFLWKGKQELLLKHGKGYIFQAESAELYLHLRVKPSKIGLYLDCERRKLYFYNADNMSLIHSTRFDVVRPFAVYLSPGAYLDGQNAKPLTVCRY